MVELILASASPRRAELLSQLGLTFQSIGVAIDESLEQGEGPVEAVRRLAQAKADEVNRCLSGDPVIIAADTLVAFDGLILGKPTNSGEAIKTLTMLSGQTHQVYTGLTVIRGNLQQEVVSTSRVRFRELESEEIQAYVETGEPMDKAGSYGIQGIGGMFVASLEGSYSTVVGLPLCELSLLLRQVGVPIFGARRKTFY